MPLYQMLCISAHYPEYKHLKSLVQQACTHLLDAGSVVRRVDSWGPKVLPQRMRRHGQWHNIGDYWTLQFDTSPRTLRTFNSIMRRDPRVVRWTVLKVGEKPTDIVSDGAKTLDPAFQAAAVH